MLIMVTSYTEESPCRPVLQGPPDSAAWTPEGGGGPRTLFTLLVQSIDPRGKKTEYQPLSQHLLFCRDAQMWGERRAELHQKGKVMKEIPHPGLGLWSLLWASGAGCA